MPKNGHPPHNGTDKTSQVMLPVSADNRKAIDAALDLRTKYGDSVICDVDYKSGTVGGQGIYTITTWTKDAQILKAALEKVAANASVPNAAGAIKLSGPLNARLEPERDGQAQKLTVSEAVLQPALRERPGQARG